MPEARRAVVVGGSAAGSRAADVLCRSAAFDEVAVLSRDPAAPHYRPALSKQLLSGEWDEDRARLPRRDHPALRWLAGTGAAGLDLHDRTVTTDDGSQIDADAVVLAPGCRPRALPGVTAGRRVVALHSLADARLLAGHLVPGGRLLIIGAGLIGSEIAAAAVKHGVEATLVDPSPTPLVRALGPLGDRACMAAHARSDCELVLGSGVSAVEEQPDGVAVTLSSGETRLADTVAVCVGVTPDTAWLADSGIPVRPDGGIQCDGTLTVDGLPWITAAGDAAAWWAGDLGTYLRVEHWATALSQGALAAANVCLPAAERVPFTEVPLFWTEQHGVTIHVIGRHSARSEWPVVEGDPAEGSHVAVARTDGQLTGALLVGSPHRLSAYREMVRAEQGTAAAVAQ
jgi:NADPH-dependent 2,4-dienoyl-CoA reductase/sulfur reductase-like enzyme